MEEEYQEKVNTYSNDSMVLVKNCTITDVVGFVQEGFLFLI